LTTWCSFYSRPLAISAKIRALSYFRSSSLDNFFLLNTPCLQCNASMSHVHFFMHFRVEPSLVDNITYFDTCKSVLQFQIFSLGFFVPWLNKVMITTTLPLQSKTKWILIISTWVLLLAINYITMYQQHLRHWGFHVVHIPLE